MKMRLFIVAALTALCLPIFGAAPLAHADVNDFTIDSFAADDTLTNADHQGQLRIIEHIKVTFADHNHGILRALPGSYKRHRLQLHVNAVSSDSGAPAQYSTYGQNGNLVLKIGDPDQTVTGQQEYTVDYTVRNVIGFYKDHDELYWDINGDQWQQWASQVTLQLHLPQGLQVAGHVPTCYTGSFGDTGQACVITADTTARLVTAQTTGQLAPEQTLTVVVGFAKGFFHTSAWYETLGEYIGMIISFAIPFALLAGAGWAYWFARGRDPKGRGIIVPEYGPPDHLSPLEVGTLVDFKVDNRDITATIIDLAVKRYLKIIELKKDKKFSRPTNTYALQLVNPDFSKLNRFETALLSAIFIDVVADQEVDLSFLKYKLAKVARTLRQDVNKTLLAFGYFRNNPTFVAAGGAGGTAVAAIVIGFVVVPMLQLSFGAVVGCVLGGVVGAVFLYKSSSRTAKGVAANEHIKGLKMYMEIAEKQRLKMLQSPESPYVNRGNEPKQTIDLFEKLLPYAIVLGVENQWAKKFTDIYRTPPDWYSGNWTTFNVLYLTSSLGGGFGGQLGSSFSAPSSSNSSGFGGGGGFSGGGGGGGGGGGW